LGHARSHKLKPQSSAISPARVAAFEILSRVADEGAYASVLLASRDHDLIAQDRALTHELTLGVLRWQLYLDHLISHYANRDASRLDQSVLIILRMGLYQLRFLTRIPAAAAVNDAVKLVRLARVSSADKFVNAILRRAVREPDYDPFKMQSPGFLLRLRIRVGLSSVGRSRLEWLRRMHLRERTTKSLR
jgi:transcription termination factor NusB